MYQWYDESVRATKRRSGKTNRQVRTSDSETSASYKRSFYISKTRNILRRQRKY